MKIPQSANPDVRLAIQDIWNELDRLNKRDIDLKGRRIINSGNTVQPLDLMNRAEIERKFGFDAVYAKLKEKGVDGLPGKLADPQIAITAIPEGNPAATQVGEFFYDRSSSSLVYSNGNSIISIVGRSVTTLTTGIYNLTGAYSVILCDAVDGAIVLNLPEADTCTNKSFIIKKVDVTDYTITLTPYTAEKIDESTASIILYFFGQSFEVISDGVKWWVISS